MYERIMVPLDGSELAEGALPYAEGLAIRLHSEVILVTACAGDAYSERPLRAYLEKRAKELQSLGVKAGTVIVRGNAADEILDFAEENNISLVIISTHGRTGISRWPLGSISNKVLQKSDIPVLLIRSRNLETVLIERKLQKVLVLLDGSKFSENIIPYAFNLVDGVENEVILFRVSEPVQLPDITLYSREFDKEKKEKELTARVEEEARRYLSEKESALRDKGVKVSSTTQLGKPAETILRYAEENSVSLIALASHGFSGITKWAYGSVAYKIIEGSTKPVLLIRPVLPGLSD